MKLPSFRKIIEQDYPSEYQELVKQLAVSINHGIEVLYDLLNGKLSIKDNLATTIKEIDIEVDAKGKPKSTSIIKKSTSDRIEGLWVLNATNLTNSNVYPTGGVFVSYTETSESITINNVAGIPANNIFRIKIVAIR